MPSKISEKLLQKALAAKRESRSVDFKSTFDISVDRDWCEIIKDIIAMANSGGGVILFGVDDYGQPTGMDSEPLIKYDSAKVVDKIYKFTNVQFSAFEFRQCTKGEHQIAALLIDESEIPIVFVKAGLYQLNDPKKAGHQGTAFQQGTIYFRHGAKSETVNNSDIRSLFDKHLENLRKLWLESVTKVIQAPPGYEITINPPNTVEAKPVVATPFQLTDDPTAPIAFTLEADKTHPYRQKDIIEAINNQLSPNIKINSYDILAIRQVYNIEKEKNYFYKSKFSPPQYSQLFLTWLIERCSEDREFLTKTRGRLKQKQK